MRVVFFSLLLLVSHFATAADLILAEQVKIKSAPLGTERNLLVKLPKGYHDSHATYPVLYVLHAQWDMLPALSALDLLEGQVPEFIVIGIESQGRELRPDEGKTTPFANFLSNEVIPYVNSHYRTAPYRILSGHSNSGRFVLDFWLNQDPTFSTYYAFSPSLDDNYIVDRLSAIKPDIVKRKAPVAITMANEGDHMQKPFALLTQTLQTASETAFFTRHFPQQSHRTTKHPSMQFALQSTFSGWAPSYETKASGFEGLTAHYAGLSKKFGFRVDVPNQTLQRLTAHYAISGDESAVAELKKYIAFTIKQTPQGIDYMFEIADYLADNNYQKAGDTVLNEICRLTQGNQRCVR